MKKDCPLIKSKFKKKNEHFKKKNALQATWDDSDSSSSENEETDNETADMCFTAQLDDVSNSFEENELLIAFNELFCEFKKEKLKNKFLMKKNEKFSEENSIFNIEMKSLKSHFSDLENNISSLKIKYVDSLKNINSFKKKNMSHLFEKNFKHSCFNKSKHRTIWVPKYLNSYQKKIYISSNMKNVSNINDYDYANNWKPNSKWVWISKD